jgi:hypothetical protein
VTLRVESAAKEKTMEPPQTLAEWLAEDERRYVVMRQSKRSRDDGTTYVEGDEVRFDVYTHLPDGRRVASGVAIPHEMLGEPEAGEFILLQAKLAVCNLLRGSIDLSRDAG